MHSINTASHIVPVTALFFIHLNLRLCTPWTDFLSSLWKFMFILSLYFSVLLYISHVFLISKKTRRVIPWSLLQFLLLGSCLDPTLTSLTDKLLTGCVRWNKWISQQVTFGHRITATEITLEFLIYSFFFRFSELIVNAVSLLLF